MRIVEQPFARQEVPHHHNGGCDELADIGADQIFRTLRHVRIMVHAIRGNPNNGIVHEQADQRANHEDDNLHPTSHVIAMLEHQFHAGDIVENQGNNERDGCGEHVVHVEYADEKIQNAPVDNEGDHANEAKFHKLFNQFSHNEYLTRARRPPWRPSRQSPKFLTQPPRLSRLTPRLEMNAKADSNNSRRASCQSSTPMFPCPPPPNSERR